MLPVYRVAASTSLALLLMPPMVVPLLTAHSMPPSSTATPPGRTSDQPGPKAHQPVFWPAAALTPLRGRRLGRRRALLFTPAASRKNTLPRNPTHRRIRTYGLLQQVGGGLKVHIFLLSSLPGTPLPSARLEPSPAGAPAGY